ncbi:unnamed protein product [Closterium sp. Naga37s-1]|nr:unnamed protein product [Closterium sp. Naga37s-1]
MARRASPSSRVVLTFAALLSASFLTASLPRLADAVPLSFVLTQVRNKTNTSPFTADISAGMVEFAAGYDKATDIAGGTLFLPIDAAWTAALNGYKAANASATIASDPLLEALDTLVKTNGSLGSLNSMSSGGRNALSRLAKFLAIREYLDNAKLNSTYKSGRFSFSSLLNQNIWLYGDTAADVWYLTGTDPDFLLKPPTGSAKLAATVAAPAPASGAAPASAPAPAPFADTTVDTPPAAAPAPAAPAPAAPAPAAPAPAGSGTGALVPGSGAGGPKAVSVLAIVLPLYSKNTILGVTTSSSDVSVNLVSDVVFPSNMASLTSFDATSAYGTVDKGANALFSNGIALLAALMALLVLF